MNKKILYLIGGVAVIVLGVLSLFDRNLTMLLCGIMFVVYGAGDLLRWIEGRKTGTSSFWMLFGAAISFVFGACIFIGNTHVIELSGVVVVVIFSLWLMASGVFEILGAIMYRKAMTSADLGVQAPGSVTSMVSGGIMIAVGLLSVIIPMFAMVTAHIWISVGLIIAGVRLIAEARTSGELEGST